MFRLSNETLQIIYDDKTWIMFKMILESDSRTYEKEVLNHVDRHGNMQSLQFALIEGLQKHSKLYKRIAYAIKTLNSFNITLKD